MSHQNQNFGIMDEGYFVPRSEIISWINNLLKINITKIQQLGSGSIYCQILDIIFPGKVALNKVNWRAKLQYQFISNLKILQNSFDKLGIKRHIQVEKISKAKYQDNLELIQWFKRYYDVNCGERGKNYQAQERRGDVVPDFSFAEKTVIPKVYNNGTVLNQHQVLSISNKQKPKKQIVQQKQKIERPTEKSKPIIVQRKNQQQQKLEMIYDIVKNGTQTNDQKIKLIEQILSIQ